MVKRPEQTMPDDIRDELEERVVIDDQDERPFYQRNDYLAWIGRTARSENHCKRIDQMVMSSSRAASIWA